MADITVNPVLAEVMGPREGSAVWVKRAFLVIVGVIAMTIAAKIKLPMWPVPATMQTFVVLSVGAAYGLRLGLTTLLCYLALGAIGLNVFTGSSVENYGIAYMMGSTGGYLLGFAVATVVMGALARRGWDRSMGWMALAMLIGNVVIYAFGLPWMAYLFVDSKGLAWVMQWGLTNFLVSDAVKLALAAMLMPMMWKLVGNARG